MEGERERERNVLRSAETGSPSREASTSPHVFKEVDLRLVLDVQLGELVIEVGPHRRIRAARESALLQVAKVRGQRLGNLIPNTLLRHSNLFTRTCCPKH